ncbi:hypothetical protein DFS34DRAFT_162246 [Phlyctochytrium arcticum]|nr:hypothetical protein DFS34DRAFT_162246 [Phlyctochytrium arcticum]
MLRGLRKTLREPSPAVSSNVCWSCRLKPRYVSSVAQRRLDIWAQHAVRKPTASKEISVRMGDRVFKGIAGISTPQDALKDSFPDSKDAHLLALLNKSSPWDLQRPLEADCTLEFIPAGDSSELAHRTVWHSGAHLLGWAMESYFGDDILLCDGPALKSGGFYYDALLRKDLHGAASMSIPDLLKPDPKLFNVNETDMKALTSLMKNYAKKKARFQRLVVSRDVAKQMFADNPFKLYFLEKIPQNAPVTLYRCGDFIDLCRGPHVPHTGFLKSHKLLRTGGAQWDAENGGDTQPLSRVYGIAFDNAPALQNYELGQAEAAKRDHRLVGKQQGLFTMHPLAPGSPFMLPHGTRIVQRLLDFLRREYRIYGYDEVVTPLMFNKEVWETSGHWENYKDDMYVVDGRSSCCGGAHEEGAAEDIHGLKPMNCPGHCLLFANSAKSYRELPIRYAEFSPLHRNESSGALTGLTRVRKFHQDDAHVFCTPNQINSEITSILEFIDKVYRRFKFQSYELTLSTRPQTQYIGSVQQWDDAENQLRSALDATGRPWTIKPGDGAFYGPKIDIMIQDALGRSHQTATVQLDFQLPTRFGLKYQTEDGDFATPVIIHRAILGSVERMMAVLIEHYGGKWPFWLSPRQAMVIPVAVQYTEYAQQIRNALRGGGQDGSVDSGWFVDVDVTDHTLPKRIREAQKAQYNFMIVVGEQERAAGKVTVRTRGGENLGMMDVSDVASMFCELELRYE